MPSGEEFCDEVAKQELSYDAWGRLRNPATQVAYAPESEPALFLGRGYTGHEHLAEFGLIDMNGRMYDPLLGRFLSPDPYVQMPDFSQNYNRYSYCLNNPLIYVDETGEFFWLIPHISWSKKGGLSIGISAIVGIPGIASAQAGIGYNFKHNDFNAYVGATAAFNTLYVSYSTKSYVANGGKVVEITIPRSTIDLMQKYDMLNISPKPQYHINGTSGIEYQFHPSMKPLIVPRFRY